MNDRNSAESNADEQRSNRQHTGLRTLDEHYSAKQVYQACLCPYPGTLAEKAHLRARNILCENSAEDADGIATDGGTVEAGTASSGFIRPPNALVCGALGCQRTEGLARVYRADRGARVLCGRHRKHFLGVST